jgi:HEPN domain-containing protein
MARHAAELLTLLNRFNIEGRYPDAEPQAPSLDVSKKLMRQAKEMIEWLLSL